MLSNMQYKRSEIKQKEKERERKKEKEKEKERERKRETQREGGDFWCIHVLPGQCL